ncbi:MAG: DUF2085 domain-containing protein [Polyangiales bacterium]
MVLALVGLSPFVSVVLPDSWLARWLSRWFSVQCHGRLDRTLALFGHYFPVCSRCLGIYLGLAVGALLPLRSLAAKWRRAWLLSAAVLMVIEVMVQDTMRHEPWHPARILTGVLLAWPVGQILIAAARGDGEVSRRG